VADTTETEGVAVFLKDKRVGYLDKYETRGYLFATGGVKSTIVELENPLDTNKHIGIEIEKASAEKKLEWNKDGSPKFTISIKVKAVVAEQINNVAIEETKLIKMLEASCNEKIKEETVASITKCQKEYNSDVFGFGAKVFDKKPDYWKQVKEEWNKTIYPNIEVKVEVDTKLLGSGLIGKSLDIK